MWQLPELVDMNSDQQDNNLQTSVVKDRDTLARRGLSVNTVDITPNNAFGQRQAGVIYSPLNQHRVGMKPTAFAKVEPTSTLLSANHQSGTPASARSASTCR